MSGYLRIAPIVEGDGEVEAVPILLRRLVAQFHPAFRAIVLRPIRQPRDRLLRNKDDTLIRSMRLANAKLRQQYFPAAVDLILVLCDSDSECAASLAPAMRQTACLAGVTSPIAVVLAVQEYETWFVAAAESLEKFLDLKDARVPMSPESDGSKKAWIEKRFRGTKYSETIDQALMTAAMDLLKCRERCPSFDKLCREIRKQLGEN